jgi:hypothetical protein
MLNDGTDPSAGGAHGNLSQRMRTRVLIDERDGSTTPIEPDGGVVMLQSRHMPRIRAVAVQSTCPSGLARTGGHPRRVGDYHVQE